MNLILRGATQWTIVIKTIITGIHIPDVNHKNVKSFVLVDAGAKNVAPIVGQFTLPLASEIVTGIIPVLEVAKIDLFI